MVRSERCGCAAVACSKGPKHSRYEDSYTIFPKAKKIVSRLNRGEIFAVFDGIGSAPEGGRSAEYMSSNIILERFYQQPDNHPATWQGIRDLLFTGNMEISKWGLMPGKDRPLGGCAGTVAWINEMKLYIFHAGDTLAILIRDRKPEQLTHLHEKKGAIYRYYGLGENLEIEIISREVKNYDRILLISDGVTKAYSPKAAVEIIEESSNILHAVTDLVQRSRTKGSTDDITALLIEIDEYGEE
jgi:PPM family protein phosphatase